MELLDGGFSDLMSSACFWKWVLDHRLGFQGSGETFWKVSVIEGEQKDAASWNLTVEEDAIQVYK